MLANSLSKLADQFLCLTEVVSSSRPTYMCARSNVKTSIDWSAANNVHFLFGLAKNARLIGTELVAAAEENKKAGKPARYYKDFEY